MTVHSLFRRASYVLHSYGVRGLAVTLYRRLMRPSARSFRIVRALVTDATGLEIGGPSAMFDCKGLLPIYPLARRIDNCNFAAETLWERNAEDGQPFSFSDRQAPGRQFVAEATDLHHLKDESYDFVISSHSLEHTANPLKALAEWRRVLRRNGLLVLVVPHKDGTFDHRRPVTTLEHLQADFQNDRGEDDLTHLEEVVMMHDLSRDIGAHDIELRERMSRNPHYRSMHHHVFDTRLAVAVCETAGFNVTAVEPLRHDHIIVVADRGDSGRRAFTVAVRSPFPSDLL